MNKKRQEKRDLKNIFKLVILWLLMVGGPLQAAQDGLGPFFLPPLGIAEDFRQIPEFVDPDEHASGRVQLSYIGRWINVWAYNNELHIPLKEWNNVYTTPAHYGTFLLDYEGYMAGVRASVLVGDAVSLEVKVPVYYITGGKLDGSIEAFHSALDIGQHRRDEWPRNETHLMYVTPWGSKVVAGSDAMRGAYLGDISLGAAWHIRAGNPSVGLRLTTVVPSADVPETSDSGSRYTLQLTASWQHGSFCGYHGIGYTRYNSTGIASLNLKKWRLSLLSALEYRINHDWSLIAHGMVASAAADYPRLDKNVIELSCGFKRRFENYVLEFAFVENLFFYDNSPDIGFHVAVRMPFN